MLPDIETPPGGLHIRWPDAGLQQEIRLHRHKIYAALAFHRANGLDRIVIDSPRPRLGIIATGKAYLDTRQALDHLGIDDDLAADIGLRLYKVAMPWPLEPAGARDFARGLEEVIVIEEKRALIENQLKEQLYNWDEAVRPRVVGKFDEEGKWLLPASDELSPAQISKVIGEHKASFDPETPRDFIDSFLAESAKPGAHSSFNEFQLQVLCSELFGAGGEPTSVTLKWALRFLALNPEVQAKAAAEIEAAVGNDSRVAFADRSKLPYVQALVHEIVRFSDIHPIGVLHSPSVDTSIDGYAVPEGTFVFPNFHQIHRDPEHWSHPDVLHPEHWLDAEGRFTGGNRKGFIAFGVGKRKCPGQEVALMELFVFVSNLVQKFKFSLPDGAPVDCEKTMGAVVGPKPYDIVLEPRF